jgi:DNA-directed RNA polymerase subunit RPC12/RpoP
MLPAILLGYEVDDGEYLCVDCGVTYTHRSSLIRHCVQKHELNVQQGPSKPGSRKARSYQRYRASANPQRPYQCLYCTSEFTLQQNLYRHNRDAHPNFP